ARALRSRWADDRPRRGASRRRARAARARAGLRAHPPAAQRPRLGGVAQRLCKGEDVEELHVQPVGGQPSEPGNSVLLLEAEHELLAGVLDRVELVEPECERRRLLTGDEENLALDVVRAPEVVALTEYELPLLPHGGPVLDDRGMRAEPFLDPDLDRDV